MFHFWQQPERLTSVSLCPAAPDEPWWCQQSTRSFLLVPRSQCSMPQGKLGALWKVSLLPSRSTPYFPAPCGVLPGDKGPLQGWNSETCKEGNPRKKCKSYTVCPSFGGGITAMWVLSLLVKLVETVQHLWEPARPKDQLKHANLLQGTAVWQTFLQFNYKLQCRSRKRKKQAPNYLAKNQVWSLYNNRDLVLENTWKQRLDKWKTTEQQYTGVYRSILSFALFTLICNFLTKYC